ncbi:ectoine/hydroxyectoine ABC transporter permease subunit EhuC [Hwanghaeella grinnelliae]|uniref:Ectoine/hydroxyectoine ABC transporter permease subunit EhuC n=1 Tax=Hwanghaeella grinnelliae TaxID=2500179 RepID=A0A3S2W929_9PROT|nr:ectoine/hydroxyectoine ABC transporter permease subunit EhuC [Hwanghaeella grinnelliae]RVU36200.1 ectoine/hydroxyectoine ABC transporter permease subunit EhuC [Hwanghaeella grinnelliae]
MDSIIEYSPILIKGTITTIQLTLASAVLALTISFIVGLARFSRHRSVRAAAICYLEFFRGTSAIVQMFFMYYVLPLMGVHFSPLTAGILACGCNLGSYGSEVVRGAIQSVSRGQHEAALALNYTTYQRYRYVLIPQAIPVMIPTFSNLLIELMKLTAVASLITISDLTFMAQIIRVQTALTLEPFLVILVIYFIIATLLVQFTKLVERKFSKGRQVVSDGGR